MFGEYFGAKKSRLIPFFIHYLRMWDVTSSQRVDDFLAISKHVRRRIMKYYRRDAEVIYPPVDTRRFKPGTKKGDFFLIVSSLVPYKAVDLAVEAFNRLGYPLRIIGSGPEEQRLRAMARSNVAFLGWQRDEVVAEAYSRCRALIFPGEEDFGIVPLEAMASGRPVIAYGRGGALETVVPPDRKGESQGELPTGLFFYDRQVGSLIEAMELFIKSEQDFDPAAIRNHSLRWDRELFKEKIKEYISGKSVNDVKEARPVF
jgi:glycosyltransferase involved in cell wall biosynthesis